MRNRQTLGDNAEFAAIDAAIKRAAKAAHTLARKTKTPCYIWKDGTIVDLADVRKRKQRIKTDAASDSTDQDIITVPR